MEILVAKVTNANAICNHGKCMRQYLLAIFVQFTHSLATCTLCIQVQIVPWNRDGVFLKEPKHSQKL